MKRRVRTSVLVAVMAMAFASVARARKEGPVKLGRGPTYRHARYGTRARKAKKKAPKDAPPKSDAGLRLRGSFGYAKARGLRLTPWTGHGEEVTLNGEDPGGWGLKRGCIRDDLNPGPAGFVEKPHGMADLSLGEPPPTTRASSVGRRTGPRAMCRGGPATAATPPI